MNHADFNSLVDRVVRESGAVGWTRRNLRRELESHTWEAVRALREQGVADADIPPLVIERFGSPEVIGKQFSVMHGLIRNILRVLIPIVAVVALVALLLPGDGQNSVSRYNRMLREKYLDIGWYYRALEVSVGADPSDCDNDTDRVMNMYIPDGIGITYIPAGHIIRTCYTKWLVLKFLPPIQLSGPDLNPDAVIDTMKMEGGLRSVDVVFGEEDIEGNATRLLEQFLESLQIGAGNVNSGLTEIGSPVYRVEHYHYAAALWDGDVSQLAEWNPDVDAADEPALWIAACERQLQCYGAKQITVRSLERLDDSIVVTLDVRLASGDETIDGRIFTFEVTRFEDGYPNDWTDDIWRVTEGLAYLP